jgi:hypothetical protein
MVAIHSRGDAGGRETEMNGRRRGMFQEQMKGRVATQFATRSPVLILRSAHAPTAKDEDERGMALMLRDASQRSEAVGAFVLPFAPRCSSA